MIDVTGLAAPTLLRAWEAGEPLRGVDRALAVLAAAGAAGAGDVAGLAALPLGRRDALLLEVHSGLGGPPLVALADCAGCDATLEVRLDIATLVEEYAGSVEPGPVGPGWRELDLGTAAVRARPPNSADLAALDGRTDVDAIRAALVQRCVASVSEDRPLTEEEVTRLAERLEALDPLADVRLDVGCAGCDARTEVLLDVPALVWARLRAAARRLVVDVGALATRYGWAEADIVAMSPARRELYLGLP